MRYNPQNLPIEDNLNRFAYCAEVTGETIVRKGKMVACYGNLRFESLGSTGLGGGVRKSFNAPAYAMDFMGVTGQGKLILGDNGNDVAAYNVEDATFTLRAANILAYQSTLKLQESTLPGFVTLLGTGRLVASSNGPVVMIEPPCRVDPEAIIGWADMPSPSYRYDYGYVRGLIDRMGVATGISASGEEKQLDFVGKGVVLVQSSEQELAGRSALTSILAQLTGLHQQELVQLQQTIAMRLQPRR